ncbi:glycosyltransferase family 2 protein [Algoriphagus halophytocola]|uniref:Glycosyltransferase family 2 protein n=1 Tax=Algoriphagus halophytocola TaxID=2991499 RepID=A0ABY6MLK9_9BACT|nr:glycosyltransferase family 2 protein [Algoriphagus sp. TR-M5]UZD23864.1 glycosyltransferase family 2 protein [Algoriphagus sp. TR-M5]
MFEHTKLVVILVNYNGYSDTKSCLQSILNSHSDDLPFVVLVDNASSEPLPNIEEFYPIIHIIRNSSNIGFGRANNQGINWANEHLQFSYLLLLNNDTLVQPGSFNALIKPFEQDDRIAITTCKTMYEGKRDIVWYGGGEINFKRGWPSIQDFNKPASLQGANNSRYVSFASGCVMMFTKQSIKEFGGFDDNFFMYCEDLELCLRVLKMGYKIYYTSEGTIYHKVQGSTKGKSVVTGMNHNNPNLEFLFTNMKVNQFKAMEKNIEGLSLLIFKFVYSIEFSLKVLKLMIKGRMDMPIIAIKTLGKI